MMKKKLLAGVICVLSTTAFAQLPDEINYSPYYNDYTDVRDQRDATSDDLSYSRESLESILNSIDEYEDHILVLQGQIADYQKRISYLQRILPQRTSDLRQNESELSSVESQLSQQRSRQANLQRKLQNKRQNLRPIQSAIGQKEAKLRDEQKKLQNVKGKKEQKVSERKNTQSAITSAEAKIVSLREQIAKLKEQKLTQIQKISELKTKVQSLGSKRDSKKEQLEKTKMQVQALTQRLAKEKAKLAKLQANNADPEAIKKQQQKVRTTGKALNVKKQSVKTIKKEIDQIKSKIAQVKGNIQKLEQSVAAIPGKISSAKSKVATFKSKKDSAVTKLAAIKSEIQKLNKRIENIKQRKLNLNQEIASLDSQAEAIKEKIRMLAGKLQNVERNIASNESLRSGLLNRISHLRDEIRDINSELPSLRRSISSNSTDIASSRNTIAGLKQDESQARNEIYTLEGELADLRSETNQAYDEYSQRQNLYDHYLVQSQDLGESQTNPANALGTSKGLALAKSISEGNGSQIGKQYGSLQANLIGMVRGEITGYKDGYEQGVNTEASIKEGTVAGMNAGTKAAINYAQTVLKPGFFENHLQDAFKGPLKINSMKMMGDFFELEMGDIEKRFTLVDSLTNEEVEESLSTKTSLDSIITKALSDEVQMEKKFIRFSKASFSYVEPTSIPFGKVSCTNVYKSVDDFKKACKASYTKMFRSKFLDNSYAEFEIQYKPMFLVKFKKIEGTTRTNEFPQKYGKAFDTAFVEAEANGKQDAYDAAYEKSYKFSYDDTLPGASKIADEQSKNDVATWSSQNPVVTLTKTSFSSKVLRGGKQGYLLLDLKNIGDIDSLSTGSITITKAKNLSFKSSIIRLDQVSKKSLHQMKIPFIVNENAGSGEKIVFSAKLNLPGDKYKGVRIEASSASQVLVKNPKYNASIDYNKTPKVKGVFKYYIHGLKVNIAPMVEGLPKGYKVSLKALGNAGQHMKLKVAQGHTGSISKLENKLLEMSYVFKKSAKGKSIKLQLEISYNNEVLKTELIELSPR